LDVTLFWDTNLFIYLWEDGPCTLPLKTKLRDLQGQNVRLVTSTLTLAEILVQPQRVGSDRLVHTYRQAFSSIPLFAFTSDAALSFARLRAAHPSLRPPDAIQLSCAAEADCDLFVTNDRRLSGYQVPGIQKITSLGDWLAKS
jgi:predicted nucleic acid-binding protein